MESVQTDQTTTAKRSLREKFRRRRGNLFRKADELSKIAGALVYVLVVRNDSCYSYSSNGKDVMPSAAVRQATNFQRIERKGPQDFRAKVKDVHSRSSRQHEDDDIWGSKSPASMKITSAPEVEDSLFMDLDDDNVALSQLDYDSCLQDMDWAPVGFGNSFPEPPDPLYHSVPVTETDLTTQRDAREPDKPYCVDPLDSQQAQEWIQGKGIEIAVDERRSGKAKIEAEDHHRDYTLPSPPIFITRF